MTKVYMMVATPSRKGPYPFLIEFYFQPDFKKCAPHWWFGIETPEADYHQAVAEGMKAAEGYRWRVEDIFRHDYSKKD